MGATVSKKGLSASEEFLCRDCEKVITGREVLEGVQVFYVDKHKEPLLTTYRCEECFHDLLGTVHRN